MDAHWNPLQNCTVCRALFLPQALLDGMCSLCNARILSQGIINCSPGLDTGDIDIDDDDDKKDSVAAVEPNAPCGGVVNDLADTTMSFPAHQPLGLSQATTMEYAMTDAQQHFAMASDKECMATDEVDGLPLGVGAASGFSKVVKKMKPTIGLILGPSRIHG